MGDALGGLLLTLIMLLGLTALVAWLIVAYDLWEKPDRKTSAVGGAIGSGLEDENTVRAAAYRYHPEPAGWRDERGG